MGRVAGRIAIVTGGASGIGAASARLLASEGAKTIVADIQDARGQDVTNDINANGGHALYVRLDVTEERDWTAAMAYAQTCFGVPSILFNNAGILPPHTGLEGMSLEQWRRVTATNLDGVFLGLKHGIRAMKRAGGSIINTSSIYGIVSAAYTGPYSASKGAVRLLSKAAALECATLGYPIRINSIHPGFIETAMSQQLRESVDEQRRERYIRRVTPLKRRGEAIDIAYGVLYLASDESKYVTGTELVVDGGMTAC